MDRDAHAREVIVRLVEQQHDDVQRAIDRGGLPTEREEPRSFFDLRRLEGPGAAATRSGRVREEAVAALPTARHGRGHS
jgi:hypothetical protein